jgi:hypothetical protein
VTVVRKTLVCSDVKVVDLMMVVELTIVVVVVIIKGAGGKRVANVTTISIRTPPTANPLSSQRFIQDLGTELSGIWVLRIS